jgi:chaperone required for assembly of F1-ATPase
VVIDDFAALHSLLGAGLQAIMTGWKAKRFWKNATVVRMHRGGMSCSTGGLCAPRPRPRWTCRRGNGQCHRREWAAQGEEIDPLSMPVTRSANSAIDRVATQHGEVADMLAAYAETDLLCHRADGPERLCDQQAEAGTRCSTGPEERFGARLVPTTGILPGAAGTRAAPPVRNRARVDAFRLTALHDLVSLSGSLVLGLAVAHGRLDPPEGWRLSRIDEDWQIEQWGEDEEAAEVAARKLGEFLHAKRFWTLSTALTHNRPISLRWRTNCGQMPFFVQFRCLRRVNPMRPPLDLVGHTCTFFRR